MKIGLLVPTRNRINFQLTLISSIITTVNNIENIFLYFGVDDDDPTRQITEKIANAIPFIKIIPIHNDGKFIGLSRMWNILAENCTEEIFGYIGDDMIFRTPDWDKMILEEFNHDRLPPDNIKLVHCRDGIQNARLSVNAFLHRKYYEVMGYLCRPEFLVDWSDVWMYKTFKAFDRVTYRDDIYIQHNHRSVTGVPHDTTTKRMLSDNNLEQSTKLWYSLTKERQNDIIKLMSYIQEDPDWKYVN